MRGVDELLQEIVTERNRWAHGAKPSTGGEALARAAQLAPTVEQLLRKISFLGSYRWLLVRDSRYERLKSSFAVDAGVAMNDHPVFESARVESRIPMADSTFYVELGDQYLTLAPFIVYRYCSHCHNSEMFYVDRLRDADAVLKSFARGHERFDDEIFLELNELRSA